MPESFSFDDAQLKPETFSYEEAMGAKPRPKPAMPDIAAIEKGVEEKTTPTAVLSSGEFWGNVAKNIPGGVAGGAEFLGAGVGSLAQMDFKAFANLGIISQDRATKINDSISKFTDPETEAGKLLTKWGGEIFSFAPEQAKQFAKKVGASDETAGHVGHLVEAGELALGLIKGGLKPEQATAETPPKGEPPISGTVVKPGPAGPAIEAQPKAPIEGTATRIEEPKALPAPPEVQAVGPKAIDTRPPQAKVIDFELAKAAKNTVADWYDNRDVENVVMEDPYKKGDIPQTYETTPDKLAQIPEGSSISFGNIEKGGTGVSLTRNTVPGEGPYRLTEWQGDMPIKHADYPDYQSAAKDFATHASRPDANGVVVDRLQVTATSDDIKAGNVNRWVPPGQRGMIDPDVFKEGFLKMFRAIDNSSLLGGIRGLMEPLQRPTPEQSAILKNFSNSLREIKQKRLWAHKDLESIPKATLEQMGLSVEDPKIFQQLPPALQAKVMEHVNMNKALAPIALDMGIIGNIREVNGNYFPHLVKMYMADPGKAKYFRDSGYFRTTVQGSRERKYGGTISEAEKESGLERVKDFRALVDINHDLMEAITGRNLVNVIREHAYDPDNPPIGYPGQDIPGGVSINHPAFQQRVYYTENWINHEGKRYPVKDNQVRIGEKAYPVNPDTGNVSINGSSRNVQSRPAYLTKNIKVTPELADGLKAVLLSDDPNIIVKGLLKLKAASVRLTVYNPIFHNMTIFSKIMPALPGAGFSPRWMLDPKSVFGEQTWNMMPNPQRQLLRSWVGPYMAGHYLMKDRATVLEAINDNLVIPGARGHQIDTYGIENPFSETWKQKVLNNVSEGLGDKVQNVIQWPETNLLWRQVANGMAGTWKMLKVRFTNEAVDKFVKKEGRQPTQDEMTQLQADAGKAAGYQANLLGGMFAKEDFGKWARTTLNLGLFSRSNTMSNWRLAKYGFGITPKFLQGQMFKMDEALGKGTAARMASGAAMWTLTKDAVLLMGMLTAANYLFTKYNDIPDKNGNLGGHFAWDNEPNKEKYIAISKDDKGTVTYMNIPFRGTRDIMNMFTDPATIVKDKPSTLVHEAVMTATNKDWKGKDVMVSGHSWGQHIMEYAKESAKILSGYETTFDTFNPDDNSKLNRLRLLGLQISHGAPGGPSVGTLKDIARQQAAEKDLTMQEAKDLAARGQQDKAIDLLVKNNLFSEIPSFVMRSQDPEAEALLKLKWADIYMHATPEQREQLDKLKFGNKQ